MLTAAEAKRLIKAGLSAEAIGIVIEIIECHTTANPTVTQPPLRQPMTTAERARKYREKKRLGAVTPNCDGVTLPVTPSPTPPSLPSETQENKGFEEVKKKEETEGTREAVTPIDQDIEDWFNKFWASYPKRAGNNPKKPAHKKFVTLVRHGANADEITAGALRYKRFCDATKKIGTEWVKQAQFWLSQECWNGEYKVEGVETRMTPDWEPALEEVTAMIREGMEEPTFKRGLLNFRDYHIGKGTLMADWNATWRVAMRKEMEYAQRNRI